MDLLTSIGISIIVAAVLALLAHWGDVFLLGVSRRAWPSCSTSTATPPA